jgi:hypothetical protein
MRISSITGDPYYSDIAFAYTVIFDGVVLDDSQQSPRKLPVMADDVTGEMWFLQEVYSLTSPSGFALLKGRNGNKVMFKRFGHVKIIPPTPEQILLFHKMSEATDGSIEKADALPQQMIDVVRATRNIRGLLN